MALKILTIDDDPAITEMLGYLLGSYGMDVVKANDGTQGIQLARAETPDLILLDIMMPDMDGREVCESIRSFSSVPIIVFSAMGRVKEIGEMLDAGANTYLEKPTPTSVLIDQIKKYTSPQV
jgi:two-component system response regulator MtrA